MIWVKESTSFSNETHKHISFRRFDAGQVIVSSDFTTFSFLFSRTGKCQRNIFHKLFLPSHGFYLNKKYDWSGRVVFSSISKTLGVRTISSIFVSSYICSFVLVLNAFFTMPLTISVEEWARRIELNDDEHSLFMVLDFVIVTCNAWNKTLESIFQITQGNWGTFVQPLLLPPI